MHIRNHLKDILKERNMTQIELSQATGLRPATINSIVRNNISIINYEHTEKIATALGIHNLNDLYSLEDSPDNFIIGSNDNIRNNTTQNLEILISKFNLELKYHEMYKAVISLWEEKIGQCTSKSKQKTYEKEIEKVLNDFQKCSYNLENLQVKIVKEFSTITDKEEIHKYYNHLNYSPLKIILNTNKK